MTNLKKIAKNIKKKEKPTIKEKVSMVRLIKRIVNESVNEILSEKLIKLKSELDGKKGIEREEILKEIQSHEAVIPHLKDEDIDKVSVRLEEYKQNHTKIHKEVSSKEDFKKLVKKIDDSNRDLKHQTIEEFIRQKQALITLKDKTQLTLKIAEKLTEHNLGDHRDIKKATGQLVDILVSGNMALFPPGHPKAGQQMHIHPSAGGELVVGGGAGVAQNLWETITADIGNAVANNPNDILGIRGRDGIDTEAIGDNIFIDVDRSVMRRGGISTLFTVTADVQQTTVELGDDIGIFGRDGIDTEIIGDNLFIDVDPSVVRANSSMFTVTADMGELEVEHGDTWGIKGQLGLETFIAGDDVVIKPDSSFVKTGSSMFTVTADFGPDIEIEHDDTLAIAGGANITTTIAGNTVTIDGSAMGGSLDASYTAGRTILMDLDEIIFDVNDTTMSNSSVEQSR